MKRTLLLLITAWVARPLAAQFIGLQPLWSDPATDSRSRIGVDVGAPSPGGSVAYGFRLLATGSLVSATTGVARWAPTSVRPAGTLGGTPDQVTALGLEAGLRLLGGGELPVALQALGGFTWLRSNVSGVDELVFVYGAGVHGTLTPSGVHLEPFLSITRRAHGYHDTSEVFTSTGWAIGARAALGRFDVHVGYDSEDRGPCPWTSYSAAGCPAGSTSHIVGAGIEWAL